jgi:hypothetical protein
LIKFLKVEYFQIIGVLFVCNYVHKYCCNNDHHIDAEQAPNRVQFRQVIKIGRRQRLDRVRRILFPCAFAGDSPLAAPIDVDHAPNVEPNFNFDHVSQLTFHQNYAYYALQLFFVICRSIGKHSNKDNSNLRSYLITI